MNNKANFLDTIVLPIMLLVIAMTLVITLFVSNTLKDNDIFSGNVDAQTNLEHSNRTLLNMDNMMLFIMVGLSLFVIISSYFATTHPAFLIFFLILLSISMMLAAMMTNAYEVVIGTDAISVTSDMLPKTRFIIDNLPLYILFMGCISIIIGLTGGNRLR